MLQDADLADMRNRWNLNVPELLPPITAPVSHITILDDEDEAPVKKGLFTRMFHYLDKKIFRRNRVRKL